MEIIKLQTELLKAVQVDDGLVFIQLPNSHLFRLPHIPDELACNIDLKKMLWKMCKCRRNNVFFFRFKNKEARMYMGVLLANKNIPHIFVTLIFDHKGALLPIHYSEN